MRNQGSPDSENVLKPVDPPERHLLIDYSWKWLIFDIYQFERIFGLIETLRDHHSYGITDVSDLLCSQRKILGHLQVGVRYIPGARDGTNPALEVFPAVDRHNAG